MSAMPQSDPLEATTPRSPAVGAAHLEWRLAEKSGEAGALLKGAELGRVRSLNVTAPGLALTAETVEAVSVAMESLPSLVSITVSGERAGEAPKDIGALVELHRACRASGVACLVELRLDADADPLAVMARRPSSLTALLDASNALRVKGVGVRWLVPLSASLVFRLEATFSLAQDEGVDALLLGDDRSGTPLSPDERLFAWDFLSYRLLEEEAHTLSPERARHYQRLRDLLSDSSVEHRDAAFPVTVLASDRGAWVLGEELGTDNETTSLACRFSVTEPAQTETQGSQGSAAAEIGGVLLEGQLALFQWLLARAGDPLRGLPKGEKLPTVMIIGAYGGEHIGDTAILGGVLFRIHQRHGTTRAIVMSQRPNHTRHLVPMLDVPVELSVETYEQSRIRSLLPEVDGIVFAGGPLMDLPKQLVKHLYGVSLARQSGKPFFVEGIGAGPFQRWPSEWTARRLIKMASGITLRTSDDGRKRLVRGLKAGVGRDPAFDYLETRGEHLSRTTDRDRAWIERLLQDTEGRTTVGLNIRPIRSLFTIGASASRRADYTSFVESRFEERFAEGLRRFRPAGSGKPCFIFFPMNAIQFGMSDLRSAYRIARLVRRDVDFRIWEDDASLDGVVALLRRLDVVISMRFHATIFALSQGRRVIGIDYRVGGRDKVAALLSDSGQSENCCRIDTMTSDWLASRLVSLSDGEAGP